MIFPDNGIFANYHEYTKNKEKYWAGKDNNYAEPIINQIVVIS